MEMLACQGDRVYLLIISGAAISKNEGCSCATVFKILNEPLILGWSGSKTFEKQPTVITDLKQVTKKSRARGFPV